MGASQSKLSLQTDKSKRRISTAVEQPGLQREQWGSLKGTEKKSALGCTCKQQQVTVPQINSKAT